MHIRTNNRFAALIQDGTHNYEHAELIICRICGYEWNHVVVRAPSQPLTQTRKTEKISTLYRSAAKGGRRDKSTKCAIF